MDYAKKTQDILIRVTPSFLDSQSEPEDHKYMWSYKITIRNEGHKTVKLRTRHWRIIDAHGATEEIDGQGVVGEQPSLAPGHSFEYTSGAPLRTPTGFMTGCYKMEDESGNNFDVEIPPFSLDSPYFAAQIN